MSCLDDLITELCPDGVRHTPLGDFATLLRGNGMPKTELTLSGVGAIHYGQIYTHYGTWTKETISFVSPESAMKLAQASPGDIIITNTSENLADVGKAVAWLGDVPIVTGGHATVIKHEQDPKYLSYWFQTPSFFAQKRALATGTKVMDVSANRMMKVQVPLPPLEVQREIVRILDHFTGLEAELEAQLEAELEARRQQYAHLRDRILTEGATSLEPMGAVGSFQRGRRFVKNDRVDDGIGAIHYGEIYTRYGTFASRAATSVRSELRPQLRFAQPNDVVFAAVGETVEDVGKSVAWLGSEPVAVHDDCFIFRHSMNPKYVAYWSQTAAFHSAKAQYVARAKVKRLSGENLARIPIAVRPRPDQDRIVEILDNFDTLINDLSVGLPAELVARRQQYEYYRDKLLTFEEKR